MIQTAQIQKALLISYFLCQGQVLGHKTGGTQTTVIFSHYQNPAIWLVNPPLPKHTVVQLQAILQGHFGQCLVRPITEDGLTYSNGKIMDLCDQTGFTPCLCLTSLKLQAGYLIYPHFSFPICKIEALASSSQVCTDDQMK